MRINMKFGIAALMAAAGCAHVTGAGAGGTVSLTTGKTPQQALEVARTQLVHHGFDVSTTGGDMVVTTPKAVPVYLREVSTARTGDQSQQQWFLVVDTERQRFFRGTRVRVTGYLLPPGAGTTRVVVAGNRLEQTAVPVTESNPKLFRQVQVTADWINDALARMK
jgi:hypothetical protein